MSLSAAGPSTGLPTVPQISSQRIPGPGWPDRRNTRRLSHDGGDDLAEVLGVLVVNLAVKLLLAATLLLYGSTTIYMASLANYLTSVHRLVSHSSITMPSSYANDDIRAFKADILRQSWMMTISLAINVGYFSDFSNHFR